MSFSALRSGSFLLNRSKTVWLANYLSKCFITIKHTDLDYQGIPEPVILNRKFLDGSNCKEFPTKLPFAKAHILKSFRVTEQLEINDVFQDIANLIDASLVGYGAILVRDLHIDKRAFADFISATNRPRFNYTGGNAARTEYEDSPGVMNASGDPPEVTIEPHLEMSYSKEMPARIFFYCTNPPKLGQDGQTSLCDKELVMNRLDKDLVGRLITEGVCYHRWLPCADIGEAYIYTWQKAFQTKSRIEAEFRGSQLGYDVSWKPNGTLSLSNVLPAVRKHPITGKEIWCNQSAAANKTYYMNIPEKYKEFYSNDVPGHTTYINGEEIPTEVLDHIRSTTYKLTYGHSWMKGDLLIIDNCRVAHGRIGYPCDSEREICVGLTY